MNPFKFIGRKIDKGVNKVKQDILFGIIRHALTAIGGSLITSGLVSSTQLNEGIGAVLVLGGLVWSIITKKQAATVTEAGYNTKKL